MIPQLELTDKSPFFIYPFCITAMMNAINDKK